MTTETRVITGRLRRPYPDARRITSFPAGLCSPASQAGLREGDIIVSFDTLATPRVEMLHRVLTADQKRALRIVLSDFATTFGINRRSRLASDVLAQLPSVTPAQTPGTTP